MVLEGHWVHRLVPNLLRRLKCKIHCEAIFHNYSDSRDSETVRVHDIVRVCSILEHLVKCVRARVCDVKDIGVLLRE